MATPAYRSSRPCESISPRSTGTDADRFRIHGKVQPSDEATEHHIGAILAVLAVIGVGLYLWSAW